MALRKVLEEMAANKRRVSRPAQKTGIQSGIGNFGIVLISKQYKFQHDIVISISNTIPISDHELNSFGCYQNFCYGNNGVETGIELKKNTHFKVVSEILI